MATGFLEEDDRAKILTLGFETHEPVSVDVCIQMFVEKMYAPCGFFRARRQYHCSVARSPFSPPGEEKHGEEQRARMNGTDIESHRNRIILKTKSIQVYLEELYICYFRTNKIFLYTSSGCSFILYPSFVPPSLVKKIGFLITDKMELDFLQKLSGISNKNLRNLDVLSQIKWNWISYKNKMEFLTKIYGICCLRRNILIRFSLLLEIKVAELYRNKLHPRGK